MNKQIIATIYSRQEQTFLFEESIALYYPHASITHYSSIEDISKKVNKGLILFYFYDSTPEKLENDLERIHSMNFFISINIIFMKQNFKALSRAFHYNINHILNKNFTKEDISRALLKNEAKSQSANSDLNIALEYLLETPIKVKDNLQMYNYLQNYFNKVCSFNSFSLYEADCKNKQVSYLHGADELIDEVSDFILQIKLPVKAIGKSFKFEDKNIIAFPIYMQDDLVTWGVLSYKTSIEDVLNELFFKYLQNVHLYRKVKDRVADLVNLANTDEITGLYNQRKLAQDLDRIIEEHQIEAKSFSVMFIDIDFFKEVNDLYGHVVGSQMLVSIGKVLRKLLRDCDFIYRYGGDEFVVIMTDVSTQIVHKVALRILQSIKDTDFVLDNGDIYKLSISIGIAEYPNDASSAKELIEFADEMMYESKKSGRGKVFHLKEVVDVSASP